MCFDVFISNTVSFSKYLNIIGHHREKITKGITCRRNILFSLFKKYFNLSDLYKKKTAPNVMPNVLTTQENINR